jgi:DNA-binding NarL/FixJ family response regulator
MLGFVETEFAGLAVSRYDDLSAITEANAAAEPPRLIVVDEAFVDDLLAQRRSYLRAAGTADVVFAYRQLAVARRVLEADAGGACFDTIKFLPMNLQLEVWLSVLCLLVHGETYIPSELLPLVQMRASEPEGGARCRETAERSPKSVASNGQSVLTRRELDVLALVADGKSNKVIAGQLNLSEHTVKLHLHHIIAKLGVHNRTGAAKWFLARTPRVDASPALLS